MPLLKPDLWCRFQGELFPELAEAVGRLSDRHLKLVAALEFAPPEEFLPRQRGQVGRPCADRVTLARAFLAKTIWDLATTRDLIDRLDCDPALRRLCGWQRRSLVPHESTFSRVFDEFADTDLPARMHAALIALETSLIGHVTPRQSKHERSRRRSRPGRKSRSASPAARARAKWWQRRRNGSTGSWAKVWRR